MAKHHGRMSAGFCLVVLAITSGCAGPGEYAGVDCATLQTLEEQTSCEQAQRTGIGGKAGAGAVLGAIGGAVVGATTAIATGKDPGEGAAIGAAGGLVAGGAAGAADGYVDKKIDDREAALARKVDRSLADVQSDIASLREDMSKNRATIKTNADKIESLKESQEYTKRSVFELTQRLTETEERSEMTTAAIDQIDRRIKSLSVQQAKGEITTDDLKNQLDQDKAELVAQVNQLSRQQRLIEALLEVIQEEREPETI